MNNEGRKRLRDIADSCMAAGRFTAKKTFSDYQADDMMRAAVERKLEIIGEAFVRLEEAEPAVTENFPELRKFIGLPIASSTVTTQWTKNSSGTWYKTDCPPCWNRWKRFWKRNKKCRTLIRRSGENLPTPWLRTGETRR